MQLAAVGMLNSWLQQGLADDTKHGMRGSCRLCCGGKQKHSSIKLEASQQLQQRQQSEWSATGDHADICTATQECCSTCCVLQRARGMYVSELR